jgi:hypothetical protein
MAAKKAEKKDIKIVVSAPRTKCYEIEIIGVTPLLVHQWSEKAKKEIRDKKLGVSKPKKRPILDPRREFLSAFYVSWGAEEDFQRAADEFIGRTDAGDPDTWNQPGNAFDLPQGAACFPVGAFLASVMNVAVEFQDASKVGISRNQQMLHGMALLEWSRIVMREDAVRVGQGTADLRYRPELHDWRTKIRVRLDIERLSLKNWLNLATKASQCGVGEWRPEKKKGNPGYHGQYAIGEVREIPEDAPPPRYEPQPQPQPKRRRKAK